jgi:hypothetical protein
MEVHMDTPVLIILIIAIAIIIGIAAITMRRSSHARGSGRTSGGDSPDGSNNP